MGPFFALPGILGTSVLLWSSGSFGSVRAMNAPLPVARTEGAALIRKEASQGFRQRQGRMEVEAAGRTLAADGEHTDMAVGSDELEETSDGDMPSNTSHAFGSLLSVRSDSGLKQFFPTDHVIAVWNPEEQRFLRMSAYQGNCLDGPTGWADMNGKSCADYMSKEWCTASKGYGTGWPSGKFNDVAANGKSAVQACCGCGGGTTTMPAPPASSLKATVIKVETDGNDNTAADCPAGSKVISGGCYGSHSPYYFQKSAPDGDSKWMCSGHGGKKKAYAICSASFTPTIKTITSESTSATVECPKGEKIIGGGCEGYTNPWRFTTSRPDGDSKWKCAGHSSKKRVWAICTSEISITTKESKKSGTSVSATCASGTKILGGGCVNRGSGANGIRFHGPSGTNKWKCDSQSGKGNAKDVYAFCGDVDLDDGSVPVPYSSMTASQISTSSHGAAASKALTSSPSKTWPGTCTHTNKHDQAWWKVTLKRPYKISRVVLTNRAGCCPDRLQNIDILVDGVKCASVDVPGGQSLHVACNAAGSEIKLQHQNKNAITICGFTAYGTPLTDVDAEFEMGFSSKLGITKLPYDYHWERFLVTDMGGNDFGLFSNVHSRFVRLKSDGDAVATSAMEVTKVPTGKTTGQWAEATFTPVDAGGGEVAMYCKASKRFLRLEKVSNKLVMRGSSVKEANAALDKTEKFKILDLGFVQRGDVYPHVYVKVDEVAELRKEIAQLREKADKELLLTQTPQRHPLGSLLAVRAAGGVKFYLPFGHAVALFNAGKKRFMKMSKSGSAFSMSVGAVRRDTQFDVYWTEERFLLVDAGGDELALHSRAHDRFVKMTQAGAILPSVKKEKDAQLTTSERFRVVDGGGGTLGLYNTLHKRYIGMRAKTTGSGDEMKGSDLIMHEQLPAHWDDEHFKIIDLGFEHSNDRFPYDNIYTRVRRERVEELRHEVRSLESELSGAVELLRERKLDSFSKGKGSESHQKSMNGVGRTDEDSDAD